MSYISPLTQLLGLNQPTNYYPLESVENLQINVDDGTGNKQHAIHEILGFHIDKQIKLPEAIRNVLLKTVNPAISIEKKLELPFTTQNNQLAIEIFWGHKRCLAYLDPIIKGLIRLIEIPYDNSDPERYLNSVHQA